MFLVVHLTGSNEFEVAHETWVRGGKCAWPPYKGNRTRMALLEGETPFPNWEVYDVEVLGKYSSYNEALEKSTDANKSNMGSGTVNETFQMFESSYANKIPQKRNRMEASFVEEDDDGIQKQVKVEISDSEDSSEQEQIYSLQAASLITQENAQQICTQPHIVKIPSENYTQSKKIRHTALQGSEMTKTARGRNRSIVSFGGKISLQYHHLVPKTKYKSHIWAHFSLPADENGKILQAEGSVCNICLRLVCARNGTTTNMFSHLRNHHPLVFKTVKGLALASNMNTAVNNLASFDVPQPENVFSEEYQHPIDEPTMASDVQQLDSQSSINVTNAITELLAATVLPFQFVEEKSFLNLIKLLNPHYKVPDRRFFSKNAIPKLYNDTMERIRLQLKSINECDLSLTTDFWTSVSGVPYIALMAHFVSANWKLTSVCLGCVHFEENPTAEGLAEALVGILKQWGINEKNVSSCTTDDNENLIRAMQILDLTNVSCFGHNVSIAIEHTKNLPQIRNALVRLKKLQNTIASSGRMQKNFKKAQEFLQMPVQSLPHAGPSQCWSTVKLCDRFLSNQLPLTKMFMDDHPSKEHLMLESREIDSLHDFVKATDSLEGIGGTLNRDEYTSASSVLPLYQQIKKNLQRLENESALLKRITDEILVSLQQNYDQEPALSLLQMSSFCDPRFRLYFAEDKEKVKEMVLREVTAMCNEDNNKKLDSPTCSSNTSPPKRLAKFIEYDEAYLRSSAESLPEQRALNEVSRYLSMPRIELDDNPFTWWESHEKSFPFLKILAKKYLAIQGSSVPSGRVFGTGGNVIMKHKASLSSKNAEMQVFLAHNCSL